MHCFRCRCAPGRGGRSSCPTRSTSGAAFTAIPSSDSSCRAPRPRCSTRCATSISTFAPASDVSSVVADLRGADVRNDDAPVILLRADMDALPMPEDTEPRVHERRRRRDARVRSRRARRDARGRGAAAGRASRGAAGNGALHVPARRRRLSRRAVHARRGPARRAERRRRVRAPRVAEPAVGIDLDARRRADGVGQRHRRSR